jgi:hypothetical protein
MTTPLPEPPAGTSVIGGQQLYQYPPMVPGIQTVNAPNVATPAVTASPMTVTNTTGVDVNVYLSAVTSVGPVVVNGGTIPGTAAAGTTTDYYLPAGQAIKITYSGTLSMLWQAV